MTEIRPMPARKPVPPDTVDGPGETVGLVVALLAMGVLYGLTGLLAQILFDMGVRP